MEEQIKCSQCGEPIEEGRLKLNLEICFACAKKADIKPVKGYMVWSHKTAPELCITSPEKFREIKEMSDRVGQSSILRNISKDSGE